MDVVELTDPVGDDASARLSYVCDLPLAPDRALLVTGSLFAHRMDRSMRREQIAAVQIVVDGEAHPVPFFDGQGHLGVSSLALAENEHHPSSIFYTTGTDLFELKLGTRHLIEHPIEGLVDVHELSYDRGWLHIANTGNDEVVAYHPATRECRRISLSRFRSKPHSRSSSAGEPLFVDRFHVNQVFRGLDGNLWALVHHVGGWQRLRTVMGEMIKRQGDGGVINLDENRRVTLNLSGPHSLREVRGEYWVMNSGRREVHVYSPDWRRLRTFASLGWGRGMAVDRDIAYGGTSPRRKRYLSLLERFDSRCWLEAFSVTTGCSLRQAVIRHVEQINNIYCVDRAVGISLLSLQRAAR